MTIIILIAALTALNGILLALVIKESKNTAKLNTLLAKSHEELQKYSVIVGQLESELANEEKKSANILSQKKSSETRLGQISENLVPFLENFKYDPKTAHFLGSPLDYVIFDTSSDDPAVIFLEIKTGNSKLSNNQKTIKNLIKAGKVRFEEFRLDQKGQRVKITKNED